jgi:hypothetical protein
MYIARAECAASRLFVRCLYLSAAYISATRLDTVTSILAHTITYRRC